MTRRDKAKLTIENIEYRVQDLEQLLANRLVEWDGNESLNKIGMWKDVGALVALRRVWVK